MRYAIVKNNIVENMIVWDGATPYKPPADAIIVQSDVAEIGWLYDSSTGSFSPPLPTQVEGES